MKAFFIVFSLLISVTAFCDDYYCTKWVRRSGVSCIFAGRSADLWSRQCENPCSYQNWGAQCDLTQICLNGDPNELRSSCSAWVRENNMSCHNSSSGRFEQRWVRACQNGLATSWCSDEDPNQHY